MYSGTNKKFIFLVLMSLPFSANANGLCIGFDNKNNRHQAIYLHGLADISISKQEQDDLDLLREISKDLDLVIWAPRSEDKCKNSKRCWPHYDQKSLKKTWAKIIKTAKPCLDNKKSLGVIGFSNGGYFTTKILQNCLSDNIPWGVAIGSAGKPSKSLCGKLHLLIGTHDITNRKAKVFFDRMRLNHKNISLQEFNGRHELRKSPLKKALESVVGSK